MRQTTLAKKSPKTGKVSFYVVKMDKYENAHAIWCGSGNMRQYCRLKLQLISDNGVKLLVKYHDIIHKWKNKGYEVMREEP